MTVTCGTCMWWENRLKLNLDLQLEGGFREEMTAELMWGLSFGGGLEKKYRQAHVVLCHFPVLHFADSAFFIK